MKEHVSAAARLVDNLNGDRISSESTPVVLAETLEAIARGLLAVNEQLVRIADAIADRNL